MAASFAESLEILHELGGIWAVVIPSLAGLAGAAVHRQMTPGAGAIEQARQDGLRAARLFGAAEALQEANNIRLWARTRSKLSAIWPVRVRCWTMRRGMLPTPRARR